MKLTQSDNSRAEMLATSITGFNREEHRSKKLLSVALISFWVGVVAGFFLR